MIDQREITPEILARLSALLFTQIPVQSVLTGKIFYDKISSNDIADLMINDKYFCQSYSKLECESYAQSIIDYVSEKTAWKKNYSAFKSCYLNAFDLLLIVLQDLLIVNNNRIECQYEQIFSWRTLSQYLGEELPLSAMYADRDHWYAKTDRDMFAWPYVVSHNNTQLNFILHQGISNHHCHLWASTPYFHVSWVNLMNHVTNMKYINNLTKLANSQNNTGEYDELMRLRAAWIRLYLSERLTNTGHKALECAQIKTVSHPSFSYQFSLCREKLQTFINAYARTPEFRTDYILNMFSWSLTENPSNYEILIGERWLYYSIFSDYQKSNQQKHLTPKEYNLFYAYFLIRTKLRAQLVQTNDIIGFDNFQTIHRRKSYFLGKDGLSNTYLARLAINETLKKPYIKELEVRIHPIPDQIQQLEHIIMSEETPKDGKDIRERYYYVFHFLKQKDSLFQETQAIGNSPHTSYNISCRHDNLRKRISVQAREIIKFRTTKPHLARRVLGIDAASQEIGCRPEVFAPVFRLLGEHHVKYAGYTEASRRLPPLGKTYHVGEDFLDVVDGLRAIDEVIRFLDFDCGDRLGHATVLGIDVEDWYEKKHRTISLSVQDYLDNLAWFYHALTHFSISNATSLKERLIADFEYWFRIVYRNILSDAALNSIMDLARRNCYDHTNEDHNHYQKHTCHFDIMDYYRSWTLRGDDPSCYAEGYFRKPYSYSLLVPSERCKVNESFPFHYEDRYVAEYSLLNYYYQFDELVRKAGSKRIKIDISTEYIQAAKAVQIEMRYLLARKGISIESNPTSNVLISTFRSYEKHPLLAFYNRGLPVTEQEEAECAQLQVSINTDDSGVFYTDLETEYALLARSVEQIVGDNNKPRFKKSDIYKWIDNIRIFGNNQSFRPLT